MRIGEIYKFIDTEFNDGRVDLPRDIQLIEYIPNTGLFTSTSGKSSFTCGEGIDGYLVKYWYEEDGEIKTTFIAKYDNDKVHKCETIISRKDILDHYKRVG